MDNIENLKAEEILNEVTPWINEDISFFDALVHYADKYDLEIELVGEIVRRSPVLKSKVRDDAERLHMVEKTNRLPV